MFGSETFKRAEVIKKVDQDMKIVRDQFRVHIERNPRYENPPMILARKLKALVEDGNKKSLSKVGNLSLSTGRYAILSTM